MDIKQLIQQLGSSVGLPALELNKENACALVFDGSLQVDLSYNEQDHSLYLSSIVGALQRSEKPRLLGTLLAANAVSIDLGNSHFAFEPTSESVVLCGMLPEQEQDLDTLTQEIALLVKTCQHWRQELAKDGLVAR